MGMDAAALEGPARSPCFLRYLFIHFSCPQRMMGESVKMGNQYIGCLPYAGRKWASGTKPAHCC